MNQLSIFETMRPVKFVDARFSHSIARKEPETKAEAMKRGVEHADPLWKAAALGIIRELCQTRPTFTSDDVLIALESTGETTRDTRALGGLLTQAARLKWCRKSGNYVPSKRKVCHGRPICLWESCLYSGV